MRIEALVRGDLSREAGGRRVLKEQLGGVEAEGQGDGAQPLNGDRPPPELEVHQRFAGPAQPFCKPLGGEARVLARRGDAPANRTALADGSPRSLCACDWLLFQAE
jgi:hypothetical protein